MDSSVAQPSALGPQPTSDLVTLAGQIPAEILQQLATAVQSGRWLFAVWHIEAGRVEMKRTAANSPTVDLDLSVKLLNDDLQKLKGARNSERGVRN